MHFFINDINFLGLEKLSLKISRLIAQMFSTRVNLFLTTNLPTNSVGDVDVGKKLLENQNIFGDVFLDVETDNPWSILPFSDEVKLGIDGFSWLNDLSIVNNKHSREISKSWIYSFPMKRLNRNIYASSSRLTAIARNFQYLKIDSEVRILNKVNKIFKNDYCFLRFYLNFSFDIFDKLTICHSLILTSYACNFPEKKQKRYIKRMIYLLSLYRNNIIAGLVRNPEELAKVFFYLYETIEITKIFFVETASLELKGLRQISNFMGSSLRYLQFANGNLVSAHGGSPGDYTKYVNLLAEIKPLKDTDSVSNLGFRRFDGARMSMIVDEKPPIYGKKNKTSHAGFSSFELYFGREAVFINCGAGSRFGNEFRKYCQSSKAHNVLLFDEKSQCSFGKKNIALKASQYYIKDGPRKTTVDFKKNITEKIVELSHDAYAKDYGVSIQRKLSMSLVKNCLVGQETVRINSDKKKIDMNSSITVYFHLHPKIIYQKRGRDVFLKTPEEKNMLFTYSGGNLRFEKSTYIGKFFEPQDTTKLVIENTLKKSEGRISWKIEESIG